MAAGPDMARVGFEQETTPSISYIDVIVQTNLLDTLRRFFDVNYW